MHDAEALLQATSTQTGEKIQEVRARAEESLRQAKPRLSAIEDEALRRAREVAGRDRRIRARESVAVGRHRRRRRPAARPAADPPLSATGRLPHGRDPRRNGSRKTQPVAGSVPVAEQLRRHAGRDRAHAPAAAHDRAAGGSAAGRRDPAVGVRRGVRCHAGIVPGRARRHLRVLGYASHRSLAGDDRLCSSRWRLLPRWCCGRS